MAVLVAGSTVRVGFVIQQGYNKDWIRDNALPAIEGCLYDSGQFESLEFDYNDGGIFARDYLNVKAVTVLDFARTEDYAGLVIQVIRTCAPDLYVGITRRDPVIIDAVPREAEGKAGVQQPNAPEPLPRGNFPEGPKPPGKCEGLGFTDYLACQSGLSAEDVKFGFPLIAIGGLVLLALFLKR
jgi:hypothetical protein